MTMHSTSGRWRLGIGLSLFTILMWGVAPVALDVVLLKMDPYTISWYRFLLSAVILSVWVARKHGPPNLKKVRPRTAMLYLVSAASLCGNYALFLFGLERLTPSTVVIIIQLAPIFLLWGGVLVFKEPYNKKQLIGFFILISGLALFFNQKLADLVTDLDTYTLGVVLVLLAALLWAVYALIQKQLLRTFPSETNMLVIYWLAVIMFAPLIDPKSIGGLNAVELALLVFCGMNTILAYGSFSEALDHLEASRVSAILALGPVVTITTTKLFSVLTPAYVRPEQLNLMALTGALLVVTGSMTSSLLRK